MSWDGKRIRDLRRQMNWSLADLARRLDCNHRVIMDWEMERASPGQKVIEMLNMFEQQRLDSVKGVGNQALAETIIKDHGLDQVSHNEIIKIKK